MIKIRPPYHFFTQMIRVSSLQQSKINNQIILKSTQWVRKAPKQLRITPLIQNKIFKGVKK